MLMQPLTTLAYLLILTTLQSTAGDKLKKLFVTMLIKNVTQDDDSQYGPLGRYECHAFAVGDPTERKHGFSVNVIRGKLSLILQHMTI